MTMRIDPGAQWCAHFENALAELVALAFSSATHEAQAVELGSVLMQTVDAQLHDPDLGVDTLAFQLGLSRRTIQMGFAKMNTTATAFIRARRLSRSADLLAQTSEATVTAIAFECGFNDAAYFTRCFRRHYGVPPTAWRQAAR
jgi:AraC-like DNA-binding protein